MNPLVGNIEKPTPPLTFAIPHRAPFTHDHLFSTSRDYKQHLYKQQGRARLFMTVFDFELMSREDQLKAVHTEGVYIGKRKQNLTYLLFQLEGFYVEIAYRKYRYYVEGIRTSSSTAILDPYLDEIQVNHITGMKPQN